VTLETFIRAMPKVELHVHLEGSIQPETLLLLAKRNQVKLPVDTVEEVRQWYAFTDFDHFLDVYITISRCIRTPADIEFVTREFLTAQAAQRIYYSEVTYTPYTHYTNRQIAFREQLAAINRARVWAEEELGVKMGVIIDISRGTEPVEHSLIVADWAINGMRNGVVALGLGGPEGAYPPELYRPAFERARAAGLPGVPHAGETAGADSIWGALRSLRAIRIGHGVRCLEDPELVAELRRHQMPLEVCPTSNVCLGVVPNLASHPLPRLLEEDLCVTINSDDPPMFHTTLTDEYIKVARTFGLDVDALEQLVLNALRGSLMPAAERGRLEARYLIDFARLRGKQEQTIPPTQ
jgi:adenosine deaminase